MAPMTSLKGAVDNIEGVAGTDETPSFDTSPGAAILEPE
jgi:hypothetical protein